MIFPWMNIYSISEINKDKQIILEYIAIQLSKIYFQQIARKTLH